MLLRRFCAFALARSALKRNADRHAALTSRSAVVLNPVSRGDGPTNEEETPRRDRRGGGQEPSETAEPKRHHDSDRL